MGENPTLPKLHSGWNASAKWTEVFCDKVSDCEVGWRGFESHTKNQSLQDCRYTLLTSTDLHKLMCHSSFSTTSKHQTSQHGAFDKESHELVATLQNDS